MVYIYIHIYIYIYIYNTLILNCRVVQSKLQRLIDKKNLGLYCDDSLILLKNAKRGER